MAVISAVKIGYRLIDTAQAYGNEKGVVALPKTTNAEHMKSNLNLNFKISSEDMDILKALDFKDYGEYNCFSVFSGK